MSVPESSASKSKSRMSRLAQYWQLTMGYSVTKSLPFSLNHLLCIPAGSRDIRFRKITHLLEIPG